MAKKKEKQSWIFFQSWEESVNLLSLEDKGKLLDNLINYHKEEKGEIILDTPMLKMFWSSIQFTLDNNIKKYSAQCENGGKGGRPKKPNDNPIETQLKPKDNPIETQSKPNNKLNDNDNDDDNDDEDENKDGNVNIEAIIANKLAELNSRKAKGDILNFEYFKNEFIEYNLSATELFDLFNEY